MLLEWAALASVCTCIVLLFRVVAVSASIASRLSVLEAEMRWLKEAVVGRRRGDAPVRLWGDDE